MIKRTIFGVGINDLPTTMASTGIVMPSYRAWTNMLKRCYNLKYQADKPAYIGCTVHPDWLIRSNFTEWYNDNYVDGYHLDKDIINPDNKQYSAEHCAYVPPYINYVILYKRSGTKGLPTGVSYRKRIDKYRARIGFGNKAQKELGQYSTPEEAGAAYIKAKMARVKDVADKALDAGDIDSRVHAAMHAMKFDSQSS